MVVKSGFSLLELLVVILIIGVLASLGAPSLIQSIHNMHLRADARLLYSHLAAARQYALSHSTEVHLCPKSNPTINRCGNQRSTSDDWKNGWIMFADRNFDQQLQVSEIVKLLPSLKHTKLHFNQRGMLRFFPDGSARSAGFYLCTKSTHLERHVMLLHSGRLRVKDSLTNKQRKQCLSR